MAEIVELVTKGAMAKTQEARRKSFRPSQGYRVVKLAKKADLMRGEAAGQVKDVGEPKTGYGKETGKPGDAEIWLLQEAAGISAGLLSSNP